MKIKDIQDKSRNMLTYLEESTADFYKDFVHKGEDGSDPKEKWVWNIKGSYPFMVERFIEQAIQGAYSQGYQDGASVEKIKF